MKRLVELLSATGRELAEGCEDCSDCPDEGKAWSGECECHHDPCGCGLEKIPCPRCSRWREIGAMCWHEVRELAHAIDPWLCDCGCGKFGKNTVDRQAHLNSNPTFTIPALRKLLEELGLWERFVDWNGKQFSSIAFHSITKNKTDASYMKWMRYILVHANADILTDPALFTQAVISFMEGEG